MKYVARFADGSVRRFKRPAGHWAWKVKGLPVQPRCGVAMTQTSALYRINRITAKYPQCTGLVAPIVKENSNA